jgi:hypothetical protein
MATVHSALTDLLDPLGDCMTPEVARKVVQLRSSADANSRKQLLAGKSTAGTSASRASLLAIWWLDDHA